MTASTLPSTEANRLRRRKQLIPWLFVLPTLILILAVTIFPTIYSFGLSLFKWEATMKAKPFIGLGNYITAFHDPRFLHAVWVTALLVVGGVLIEMVLGFLIAELLITDSASAPADGGADAPACDGDARRGGLHLALVVGRPVRPDQSDDRLDHRPPVPIHLVGEACHRAVRHLDYGNLAVDALHVL